MLLVVDSLLVAKINFLVTPLSYWKNQQIDKEKAKEVNNMPDDTYHNTDEITKKWSNFVNLMIHHEQHSYEKVTENKIGPGLDEWIDGLVYEHYEIDKICNADDQTKTKLKLQKCIDTAWSSLSPDPKADIHNLCQNY